MPKGKTRRKTKSNTRGNNRSNAGSITRPIQRNTMLACIVLVFIFVIATQFQHLWEDRAVPSEGEIHIHFIDVGQGNSTLVQSAEHAILIDAGPTAAGPGLAAYLEHFGVDVLDFVIATHPHEDHIGGMPAVLDRVSVRELWAPDITHNTNAFDRFLDAIERNGLEITTVEAGARLSAGIIQMTAVAPVGSGFSNLNDYSIVLHMQYGDTSFLFTGDAEVISENAMITNGINLRADVLKAGHHGSRTSSTDSFLDAVDPFAAIISAGAGNQFGHPHQEVLDRFAERDILVFRTDEMGTIVMATDGVYIHLYE